MERSLIITILVLVLCACGPGPDQVSVDTPERPVGSDAFLGTRIRYDGYYMAGNKGVFYLVRFFPQGNAVLINGMGDAVGDLPLKLVRDAQPDPLVGHYNVPVQVVKDSLFFTTTPRRGEIDYSGRCVHPDTLRLYRHSHITGRKEILDYVFQADGSQ